MGKIKPETTCIFIQDISDDESICRQGFPTDISCWTGLNNSCSYYSTHYDPSIYNPNPDELAPQEGR